MSSKKRSSRKYKVGAELDFATLEAYNYLRTNLSFTIPDKDGCKIIGITSSLPMEGKSFTSVNLAYSLAESGAKVLLVDGDLRKPSIGKILGVTAQLGLSNYLADGNAKVIHKNILNENLSVVFAGDIPPNPSELIGSRRMQLFFNNLSARFDYIIVDLPPINSVSDPLIISRLLDGTVLIVKHKYSHRKEVMSAIRQLNYAGANILGFVYNGFSIGSKYYKSGGYKYYYKHNYYTHSAPEQEETEKDPEDPDFGIYG